MQGFAGDIGSVVRRQEYHSGSNFFRIAQTGSRHLIHDAGALLFVERLGHVGLDETGSNRVHRDATGRHFTGQRLGEADQTCLGSSIVDLTGVAHGADLAQKFAEAGYNFVSLSYKDDDQYKQDAIAEFSKADSSIHGLIATDILTKGFDVSDVMIGVSARPFSKSLSSHIQQMGRVMRSHPDKEFGLWLDHSGNYLRFRDDWDDVFENGVQKLDDGREKPKKEPSKKEKEAAKCPKCSAFWPGNSDTCPNCGHVRLRRNDVEAVPGYMEELAGANAARELKRKWLAELKFVCAQENYNPGWAAHKFKEKFGSWPNGINVEPAPASLEVQRWLRSRRIAWAKARKAA